MKKILCEECGAEQATSISFFHDREKIEEMHAARSKQARPLKAFTMADLEEEYKKGEDTRYDKGTVVKFTGDCTADHEDYYITLDRTKELWLPHMRGKNWWTFKVEDQYRKCVHLLGPSAKNMLIPNYPSSFKAGEGKTA